MMIGTKGLGKVAEENDLPFYQTDNVNQKKFIELFQEKDIDLIISVNFNQILRKEIIQIPEKGCINVHASLLPKYRGRAPLNWAIINGEDKTGVTVHFIDEDIDTGDIILQREIPIKDDDYINDILSQVKEIYPKIVSEAVDRIKKDEVNPEPQKGDGFYCPKRRPEDGLIDWNNDAEDIYNLIRAVSRPYPGAFTFIDGEKVYIWRARLLHDNGNSIEEENIKTGKIIDKTQQGLKVKCGKGSILLTEIETEAELKVGDEFGRGMEEDSN